MNDQPRKKTFSEQPLVARIAVIAVCTPAAAAGLALVAITLGLLWKMVIWAWS